MDEDFASLKGALLNLWNDDEEICFEKTYRACYNVCVAGEASRLRSEFASWVSEVLRPEIVRLNDINHITGLILKYRNVCECMGDIMLYFSSRYLDGKFLDFCRELIMQEFLVGGADVKTLTHIDCAGSELRGHQANACWDLWVGALSEFRKRQSMNVDTAELTKEIQIMGQSLAWVHTRWYVALYPLYKTHFEKHLAAIECPADVFEFMQMSLRLLEWELQLCEDLGYALFIPQIRNLWVNRFAHHSSMQRILVKLRFAELYSPEKNAREVIQWFAQHPDSMLIYNKHVLQYLQDIEFVRLEEVDNDALDRIDESLQRHVDVDPQNATHKKFITACYDGYFARGRGKKFLMRTMNKAISHFILSDNIIEITTKVLPWFEKLESKLEFYKNYLQFALDRVTCGTTMKPDLELQVLDMLESSSGDNLDALKQAINERITDTCEGVEVSVTVLRHHIVTSGIPVTLLNETHGIFVQLAKHISQIRGALHPRQKLQWSLRCGRCDLLMTAGENCRRVSCSPVEAILCLALNELPTWTVPAMQAALAPVLPAEETAKTLKLLIKRRVLTEEDEVLHPFFATDRFTHVSLTSEATEPRLFQTTPDPITLDCLLVQYFKRRKEEWLHVDSDFDPFRLENPGWTFIAIKERLEHLLAREIILRHPTQSAYCYK